MGKKVAITYSPTEGNFQAQNHAGKPLDRPDNPFTFVLRIEENDYEKMIHHQGEEVPSDHYEVMKMSPDGTLKSPTTRDLTEVFGTKDELMVAYHLAREGKIHDNLYECFKNGSFNSEYK